MPEPSLEAINSFDKDANLVAGKPAVVLDISSGLKGVWDAAHEKAQYDWEKYTNHQKQVADWAANHQLNWAGVLQEDVPLLQKQATAYYQKMAQDPRKLAQIGNDPEFQQLLGNVEKSKARNSYLQTQQAFADKDPSVLTDENKKRIIDFRNGGLDAKVFQFDMPKTMDIGKRIAFFTDPKHGFVKVTAPTAPEKVILGTGKDAYYTGLLREQQSGKALDIDGIEKINRALYESNSKDDPKSPFGTKDIADDTFNRIKDPKIKKQYIDQYGENAAREFYVNTITSGINKGEFEAGKVDYKADPAFIEANKEKLKELEGRQKKSEIAFQHSLEQGDKDKAADEFINLASTRVQKALAQEPTIDTVTKNAYYRLDYTPDELTGFAIPSKKVTKEGQGADEPVTTTVDSKDIPNKVAFVRAADGSKVARPYRVLFYVKKENSDEPATRDGQPIIDQNKSYDIDEETFMKNLAQGLTTKGEILPVLKDAQYKLKKQNVGLEDYNPEYHALKADRGGKSETTYSRTPQGGEQTKTIKVEGYDIPSGATVVRSKSTGKILGYELNGEKIKL